MSVPVALERLHAEISRAASAPYLLTVGDDGQPHAVATAVGWEAAILVAKLGKRTAANIAARPLVSLLWPPAEPGGYSLIVDGTAALEGSAEDVCARITPTRGVLHRPAAQSPAPGSSCSADCVPLLPPSR